MPVVIPPGSFQLSVVHHGPSTSGSQPTWTLGITGTPDPESIGPFLAWLSDVYALHLSSVYSIVAVKFTDATGSVTTPEDIPGSVNSDVQPPNVAALIRKSTHVGGRTNQGRFYWPGYAFEADLGDDARLSDAAVLRIQGVANDLNTALSDGGLVPVILHSGSSDPTVVADFELQRLIATQRRRLRT